MNRFRVSRSLLLIGVLAVGARAASGATPCDAGLALADPDPVHGAAAIELCDVSDGSTEGLVSAAYKTADLVHDLDEVGGLLGVGLLDHFGANVVPRRGTRLLALSTGTARGPADPGYGGSSFSKGYFHTPPPGFPADIPSCPTSAGAVFDSAVLQLALVAPSWAHSFRFDFKYYTADYPDWVCTSFNDQFVALASPARAGSINGNVVFDSTSSPMTVNSAEFLTVCAPGIGYACGSGSAELTGTGFDDNGATPWLSTTAPVQPGETFTLTFFVWDTGDAVVNTTVLLDDFRWSASAAR